MPRAPEKPARQLRWTRSALAAYEATLSFIANEDPITAEKVKERVERALADILTFPGIGTPGSQRGERRFPIPNTGHVINYRVFRSRVRIQSWYRARQR